MRMAHNGIDRVQPNMLCNYIPSCDQGRRMGLAFSPRHLHRGSCWPPVCEHAAASHPSWVCQTWHGFCNRRKRNSDDVQKLNRRHDIVALQIGLISLKIHQYSTSPDKKGQKDCWHGHQWSTWVQKSSAMGWQPDGCSGPNCKRCYTWSIPF